MTGSNPDKETLCLEVEFDRFSPAVSYPPEVQIEELAAFATSKESPLINLVCILTQSFRNGVVDV